MEAMVIATDESVHIIQEVLNTSSLKYIKG